jgi:hypothetical protein
MILVVDGGELPVLGWGDPRPPRRGDTVRYPCFPVVNRPVRRYMPVIRRAERRGRKAMYPCLFTQADSDEADNCLRSFGGRKQGDVKVIDDFKEFCRLNELSYTECFHPWIGHLRRQGMAPGTVDTYMTYVLRALLSKRDQIPLSRLIKAVRVAHSDADTQCAKILNLQECRRVLCYFRNSPKHYSALSLLMASGLRLMDLTWIRRKQIQFDDGDVFSIQVRVAKNRKRRQLRAHLKPRWSWVDGLDPIVKRYLNSLGPDDRLININDAARIMTALRSLNEGVTSYSFRKFYILGIVHRFPKQVWVDWTLHMSSKMVDAHYNSTEVQWLLPETCRGVASRKRQRQVFSLE